MYNTDMPTRAELPSSKKLLRSTVLALITASLLLITVVLPAEYGIDPTGVGSSLGLKKMGEIKQTLATEAVQDAAKGSNTSPLQSTAQAAIPEQAKPVSETNRAIRNDQTIMTLKPGQATEIKMEMKKGAKVTYSWRSEGGLVNVDAHGDPVNPPEGFYHGYGKEKQIAGKEGVLEAAFDGKHGWFWRNRSEANVTITLKTSGDYQSIKKMM
ncbi:transmembrane anchor protein [Deefgea sp. CFH1-16]|uniref:transmembrane anchor protein n=1 Tax=Deefgea sp. CFH1-16 TaxID=2675457 RepID=UPI0015F66974|nr:transmembrane anchor protein [Deefgea sp. CFH1-16]MBM5573359.1 transmembrane anchor protein [Deefgea sp. CFH1-16]